MNTSKKIVLAISATLFASALVAPVHAMAAELPGAADATATATIANATVTQLHTQVASTQIASARAQIAVNWFDTLISDLSRRQATVTGQGEKDDIASTISSLRQSRALASNAVEASGDISDAARLQLLQSSLSAASAANPERAVLIAKFGIFPVAGPNQYIDSFGFPRPGGRRHKGTDIMAVGGTPVVAVKSGVVRAGSNGLGGITIWLTADDGIRYYYAHLRKVLVGSGRVTAGQVIAEVGNTGDARGGPTHLHFEIHDPNAVDPYSILKEMVG